MNKSKSNPANGITQKQIKISQTGSAPLATKTHYSFVEALRFVRAEFPAFTLENLLNHGFQGDVIFMVSLPLNVEARSSHLSVRQTLQSKTPYFLCIPAFSCEIIERDGIDYLYAFPRGYLVNTSRGLTEVLPNHPANAAANPAWLTFANDLLFHVSVTAKNLVVPHEQLLLLALKIRLRVEGKNSLSHQQQVINENAARLTICEFKSLRSISSDFPECSAIDLLRNAIKRGLPLSIFVPPEVIIRSSVIDDANSSVEYLHRPRFLELGRQDCLELYKQDNVKTSLFPAGYICSPDGFRRITPNFERGWLAPETSWRTCKADQYANQIVTCNDLYALASDIPELVRKTSAHDLGIPEGAKADVIKSGFIAVIQAVDLLKLNHPDCTVNHLLELTQTGELDFFTLKPAGISIEKSPHQVEPDDSVNCLPRLALDKETCAAIQTDGEVFVQKFPRSGNVDWSTPYGRGGVHLESTASLKSYLRGQPFPIKVKPDCLFVLRKQVLQLIDHSHEFWDKVVRAASRHSASNTVGLNNPEVPLACSPTTLNQDELLGIGKVAKLLGICKSTVGYLSTRPKDGSKGRFDENFPLPATPEGKNRKWKESDLRNYKRSPR